ncbi:MAG: aminoglycoside phosphotransferase family protein [Caldilineaceae bacterium]
MTAHLTKHRAEMARQAWPAVERFIQEHPQYTIDADQSGSASVTNYVIFGHQGEQPVVIKYFCQDERKEREVFALCHFAITGIVPQLLEDYDQRLIVMSRIPGSWLPDLAEKNLAASERTQAGRTLGQATAKLTSVPLPAAVAQDFESRFYEGQGLIDYLQSILHASWAIHQRVACYRDEIFAQSLASIEANLPYILAQPRLLYHQDAMNVHFADCRFTGFFDLEMCKVGTEAMQLGSLWWLITTYNVWDAFVEGFADVAGKQLGSQDFAASQAFAHFLVWRYISDYGDWHGEPLGDEQMTGIKEKAKEHRRQLAFYHNRGG